VVPVYRVKVIREPPHAVYRKGGRDERKRIAQKPGV
jgi:hypothetical protein